VPTSRGLSGVAIDYFLYFSTLALLIIDSVSNENTLIPPLFPFFSFHLVITSSKF